MEDTRDRLQSQELKRVESFQWEAIEREDEIQAILTLHTVKVSRTMYLLRLAA